MGPGTVQLLSIEQVRRTQGGLGRLRPPHFFSFFFFFFLRFSKAKKKK